MPTSNLPRPLANTAWLIGGALARYAMSALTMLALTHLLAPQDFGLVAITVIVQLLIAHVLPVGFHDALIQRPHLNTAEMDAAFWSVLGLGGVALLLSAILAPSIAAVFGHPALTTLLIGAAGAAWLRALNVVPRALLSRRMDFRTLAQARLYGQAVGSVAAIALAIGGAGAWSLIAQVALTYAVGGLITAHAVRWRPRAKLTLAALRPLWVFAPSVSLFTAISYTITRADDLVIGYRLGAKRLGYYTLAYALIAWVVQDVLGAAATAFYPLFTAQHGDRARLRSLYLSSVSLAAWFAYPTLVLLAVTMPVGVRVILGTRWLPMALPAQILALVGIREAGGMFNGGVYRALGVPHLHALLGLIGLPCYVLAFFIGANYGIAGVAFFLLLTSFLLQPAAWWLFWRVSGVTFRAWWQSVRAAAGVALALGVLAALSLRLTVGLSDEIRLGLVAGEALLFVAFGWKRAFYEVGVSYA